MGGIGRISLCPMPMSAPSIISDRISYFAKVPLFLSVDTAYLLPPVTTDPPHICCVMMRRRSITSESNPTAFNDWRGFALVLLVKKAHRHPTPLATVLLLSPALCPLRRKSIKDRPPALHKSIHSSQKVSTSHRDRDHRTNGCFTHEIPCYDREYSN